VATPSGPPDPAERLVFFTDAVVAIALTLLVLPLVDLVPEARRSGLDLGGLLRENLAELGAFLLSFLVVFRFWWAHHQLFRRVSGLSPALVRWNLLWLLSIVFLPWPTAVITAYPTSALTVLLYTGTLVVSTGSLTALALVVHRNPVLSAGRRPETREQVVGSAASFVALVVALVLGSVFAGTVGYWALLLLLATGPVVRLAQRWRARREGRRLPGGETDADVR
jgi:uncharacterized membrane protein